MNERPPAETATAAAIEAAAGGRWGVWLSDTGWWWATRTHALSARDLSAGCVPFLHADNPDELADRIRQQDLLTQPKPPANTQSAAPPERPEPSRP